MNENDSEQADEKPKHVSLDKRADLLQGAFEQYYRMAMDHHTKAATTSNIILVIIGAILALVGFDQTVCRSSVDVGGAIVVILIGLFGAIWAWKQHERYHYWEFVATKYQEELVKTVPDFRAGHDYKRDAEAYAAKLFWPIFARTLQDRYLWVFLHLVVVVIGIVLLTLSLLVTCPSSGT